MEKEFDQAYLGLQKKGRLGHEDLLSHFHTD